MDKFTRRVTAPAVNFYAPYHLRENPFPATPAAEYGSPDDRNNGRIYDADIRPEKVAQFRDRFLRVPFGQPHILTGYLMSLGAVESTRGMGKTAMLLHFASEINANFGPPLTFEDQRVIATYVSPSQGTKRLDQLAWLSTRAFLEQVGCDVWISVILEASTRGYLSLPEAIEPADIPVLDALEAKGADRQVLAKGAHSYLVAAGVAAELADALVSGWGDAAGVLEALHAISERRRLYLASTFFFDSIPSLLRSAGFTGMFWFVDELENVVNSQNSSDRIAWAKELRTQLVDANTAARQYGFVFPVFVTHTGVNSILSQAWTRSGLDQFAPMYKETETFTVELNELNADDSKRLLQVYLDHFRSDETFVGRLDPFAADALPRLARLCNYHPRELLRQAHLILRRAATDGLDRIDAKYVAGQAALEEPKTGRPRKGSKAKAILGID